MDVNGVYKPTFTSLGGLTLFRLGEIQTGWGIMMDELIQVMEVMDS